MNKYGPATKKQIDLLIAFMESNLLRRKFTPDERANMNEVLHTIIHTAQYEFIEAFLEEFNKELKELNEDTADVARKLATFASILVTVWKKFN